MPDDMQNSHNALAVETDVTGVILSGGRSIRMGRDKVTLCILRHKNGGDIVVPRPPGGFEPVFALYHKYCLPLMKRMPARG